MVWFWTVKCDGLEFRPKNIFTQFLSSPKPDDRWESQDNCNTLWKFKGTLSGRAEGRRQTLQWKLWRTGSGLTFDMEKPLCGCHKQEKASFQQYFLQQYYLDAFSTAWMRDNIWCHELIKKAVSTSSVMENCQPCKSEYHYVFMTLINWHFPFK